jgi:putative tryptophan/tyrosine transport system substrate-binding protein
MKRRPFLASLSGAISSAPAAALGQTTPVPIVGFLSARAPGESQHLVKSFVSGLGAEGYTEGRNVQTIYRWAEGDYSRLPALAGDLVREKVVAIAAVGGEPSAIAAKAASSTVPIVFSIGGDPVKVGLAASLNRPGSNATGVSLLTMAPEKKRLSLLHQVVTEGLIGVLINPEFQAAKEQLVEVTDAARALGRPVEIAHSRNEQELEPAFEALMARQAKALLVSADPFFDTRRNRIIGLAEQYRLPTMYQFREYPAAGGLASYGVAITEGYRLVGVYVGRILRGAKPADLPIQQSIRFEFVINLRTAKALGLTIPPIVLATADEVLE